MSSDGFRVGVSAAGEPRFETWGETIVARDEERDVTLLLTGELINSSARQAVASYNKRGRAFAAELDGSFAAAVVDARKARVLAVTDLVGSRRIFCSEAAGGKVVSTRLSDIASPGCPLDPVGVALVLATGAALNGRTLFAGVRALERASTHSVTGDGVDSRRYWDQGFSGEHAHRSPAALRRELVGLVRETVRDRRQAASGALLSLSAGLDSRAILGALVAEKGEVDVETFSYAHGAPKPGSDAALARDLAALYGVRHELVESYHGDLGAVIRENARLGSGLANFCDEVDAWTTLAARGPRGVLVGDECFGWVDVPMRSPEDVLEVVGIRGFDGIAWMARLLPGDVARSFEEALDSQLDEIYERSPDTRDLHDRKDFLYLDQRVTHVLMPWRDSFAGRLGRVQMPFLDRRILDLMQGVPSAMRRDKRLYREAIAEAFPDLLAVPRARRSGYLVNWNHELAAQGPALHAAVGSTGSRLDELVPREVVLELLARRRGARAGAGYGLKKAVDFAASRRGLAGRIARAAGARPLRRVDETTVLLRLLVLREALATG